MAIMDCMSMILVMSFGLLINFSVVFLVSEELYPVPLLKTNNNKITYQIEMISLVSCAPLCFLSYMLELKDFVVFQLKLSKIRSRNTSIYLLKQSRIKDRFIG